MRAGRCIVAWACKKKHRPARCLPATVSCPSTDQALGLNPGSLPASVACRLLANASADGSVICCKFTNLACGQQMWVFFPLSLWENLARPIVLFLPTLEAFSARKGPLPAPADWQGRLGALVHCRPGSLSPGPGAGCHSKQGW